MASSWFLSPSGRKFSRLMAFSAMSGGFLVYLLPNTMFVEKYKEITQLYKYGLPVKPSPYVQSVLEEAMDDLQMSKTKQKVISLYTSYGFDIFHAGSSNFSTKIVLGLPINFKYRNAEDFETESVVVKHEQVNWSSKEAQSLRESLIFSSEAKKFAIARELLNIEKTDPLHNGLLTSSVFFMYYAVTTTINSKSNLYTKPRSLRAFMYTIVSMMSCCIWIMCTDVACVSSESSVNKAVADISESYARGGLEFYEKILKKNMALRTLLGPDGNDLYTAYGNDQVFIRTKHMPHTSNRDYMKKRVEEYQKTVEETSKAEQPVQSNV